MNRNKLNTESLLELVSTGTVAENIADISNIFKNKVVFSTSFSFEDQIICHTIFTNQLPVEVFTIDTGRLFEETYFTWNKTIELYQQKILTYYPNVEPLQNFVTEKGPNSFYESVENRKQCCFIRKVEPLQRALAGKEIWITGIRAEHSNGRSDMPLVEYDAINDILKYHPLLYWTTETVKDYIKEKKIPYNVLHDHGFASIGCMPCTRAINDGDDFRAGRWWWEDINKKECGLHVHTSETRKKRIK